MSPTFKNTAVAFGTALLLSSAAVAQAATPLVEVYKTPTCGCCAKWIEHLRASGLTVKATDVPETATYRKKFGIGEQYGSCHTAKVGRYAIEGHVPAADIKRLLKNKPAARGLAVPGMPMGSPGMEGAHTEPYDVLLIKKDGSAATFRHVAGE